MSKANEDLAAKESELTKLRNALQTAQSNQAQTRAQVNSLMAEPAGTKAQLQKAKSRSKSQKKRS